jgi:hypothetical protein
LCSNPVLVAPNGNSPDLGTAATCHYVEGSSGTAQCGNFVAPRDLTINGTTTLSCTAALTLPAPRNGGWCFEATAGDYAWAWFGTYNVK